jgi:hypothetical protein
LYTPHIGLYTVCPQNVVFHQNKSSKQVKHRLQNIALPWFSGFLWSDKPWNFVM